MPVLTVEHSLHSSSGRLACHLSACSALKEVNGIETGCGVFVLSDTKSSSTAVLTVAWFPSVFICESLHNIQWKYIQEHRSVLYYIAHRLLLKPLTQRCYAPNLSVLRIHRKKNLRDLIADVTDVFYVLPTDWLVFYICRRLNESIKSRRRTKLSMTRIHICHKKWKIEPQRRCTGTITSW
jgi:hypothetical protein